LYIMDIATRQAKEVPVHVISDLSAEMPRAENVSRSIQNMTASPEGKRIVFEARGELFNVPVKEGYVINMTQSSGAFDREPAWSPDGQQIAYWSDRSGENEIWLQPATGKAKARQLTKRGKGYGYALYWSPDSKHIAFIDERNNISIADAADGSIRVAGNTRWNTGHGGRHGYPIEWSPDSKWITFTEGLDNANNAIFMYNVEDDKKHQVTSGFYQDSGPTFSADGKYLFYMTNREMSATYSDMNDGTWIYPNSTRIASLSLTKDGASLLAPRYDAYQPAEDETGADEGEKKEEEEEEKTDQAGQSKDTTAEASVQVDFDGIESRLELLPPQAGNIGGIAAFEGKIVYLRFPNTGADGEPSLQLYDLEEREDKTVISGVRSVALTADRKALLVQSGNRYGIIKPAPEQKIKDAVPTDGLVMNLVPREEWEQIFMDTWRRHRDFFYDPAMHGLDWKELRDRYGALLKDARTRWDVTNIQSDLAAELSAGHTYTGGGDVEQAPTRSTGYLGIDWEQVGNRFRIKRIVRPAAWDTEVRSPFDKPGSDVQEGDYILAVNGTELDPQKDPYAAFEGLDGQVVVLDVSSSGDMADAREVVIECLTPGDETQLRYLEWIENNRKKVDELSNGQLGYIYMSNTAGRGQLELVRMFYGQLDKKGFIIDERFNGGGQLADRFLELMLRPVVYNLHWRHGKDHTWPVKTNMGPMGMLINGWAGSGGDGLPWAFQELKAGPIVGERTLGILVGPATGHRLIDGGRITVPGARLYDNDGHWFWEGEGVAPDIEVWDDPNLLMQGRDPQIERVVQEVMKLLEGAPQMTPAPAPENRTAKGLSGKS
ncbi:MAG: PDZ domain-containing protein, partial [Saprospiraceae bacterium]|nr:PDZ domain-containing protein [Saprospiraceae bacterium]